MTSSVSGRYVFDHPAFYQIQIVGKLEPSLSDRLEGMAVRVSTPDGSPPITTLSGELVDQAALAGVLNSLYAMRVTVLSVVRIEEANHHA